MLSFEKKRGNGFLWLWSSKPNFRGEMGVKKRMRTKSHSVCVCRESWMWGSVSRLSENQREFETLTEAKAKFDVGEKPRARLWKRERERQREG